MRSEASGTTIRSSVQTESKSSSSARLVRSSSSLTVTLSRKFGKYKASFMRDGLLTVRSWLATTNAVAERHASEPPDLPAGVDI